MKFQADLLPRRIPAEDGNAVRAVPATCKDIGAQPFGSKINLRDLRIGGFSVAP
jgi:hypothetical protein